MGVSKLVEGGCKFGGLITDVRDFLPLMRGFEKSEVFESNIKFSQRRIERRGLEWRQ